MLKDKDYDVGWACMEKIYQSFQEEVENNRLK